MGRFPLGSKGNTWKSAKKLETKPLQKPKKINEIAHTVDKNSRTIAKICQLLETQQKQVTVDNDGNIKDDGNGILNERIEKLKRRVNRRLIKLAKWSDIPQEERIPLEFRYQKLGTLKAFGPIETVAHMGHAPSVYRTASTAISAAPSSQSKIHVPQQNYGANSYVTSQALGMMTHAVPNSNQPLTTLSATNSNNNNAGVQPVAWKSLPPQQQQQQSYHRPTTIGPGAPQKLQHTAPSLAPPNWVMPSATMNSGVATAFNTTSGFNHLQPPSSSSSSNISNNINPINQQHHHQQFQPMYINNNNNNNNNSRPIFPSLGNYPTSMLNSSSAAAMTSLNMTQTLHNASMALKGIILPSSSSNIPTSSSVPPVMISSHMPAVAPTATANATTSNGPLIAKPAITTPNTEN